MLNLSTDETKKVANQKAIQFVASLLILYFFFSQSNLFMNSVMSPGSRFYNLYIATNLDYIQALKSALIKPAASIIKAFGFYVVYNNEDVMVVNGPWLRINYSCLGFGVMSFLAAFVFAFPATWKSTFKMLVLGVIAIYILNVLRIAGLGILLGFFKSQRHNFTYHHEIFNVLVYICIFIMLFMWIKKKRKVG
ncbi:hypothetical protein EZJ43_14395 [Pedobacter changchengzhani]|uniref:Exosortase/archaeosortase family protein n=1 Tax=Pedobacter changchengzhani TaxID=2529274 RepID=A0A4V2ZZW6_9SPHI|nr:archaeosortase/exosortase family protein [Pedobacter changchengzhani]TDG35283.1 hypothetical protein EZJ43_14395 [Pedobacter changchengzhani]